MHEKGGREGVQKVENVCMTAFMNGPKRQMGGKASW